MFAQNHQKIQQIRLLIAQLWHFQTQQMLRRAISTKQLVYQKHGNPAEVLSVVTKQLDTDAMQPKQVLVRWRAAPINPADINQIQGVYAIKPKLPAVGGNEGCGVVEQVGPEVRDLTPGDFVLAADFCLGTWSTHGIYKRAQLWPVDNTLGIVEAATLKVNPPTAYRMLKDFVPLSAGDVVIQNGANSAVGRYVIQICRILGFSTTNIVRNRPKIDALKTELKQLGGTEVFTEEEFSDVLRSPTNKFNRAKLALNCVGGRSSMNLVRALAPGGVHVTYGGMSQQPVQVPTTALIFGDVRVCGFWVSRWYEQNSGAEDFEERRMKMFSELAAWYKSGQLKLPPFEKRGLDDFRQAFEQSTKSDPGTPRLKQIFVNK